MVGIMEEIELVDEEEEESIKRFKSFFFKFRRKLNINKETYEEFYQTLEDYRYIQGHVRLNLRDLYNTGYSSEDVAGIYCQAQRDEDRYEIDSDSDSDGVIYVLSSSDSESETESESESD